MAATALSNVLKRVVRENTQEAWQVLFCFPTTCLQVPIKSDGKPVSLATSVKANIKSFEERFEVPAVSRKKTNSSRKTKERHDVGKIVEAKLADGDITGAVRVISSDDSFAPNDANTFDVLQSKHPSGKEHDDFTFEPNDLSSLPRLNVTENMVRSAILSFPAGSAGGPDCLSPQHLKDLIGPGAGASGEYLLKSLTDLSNLMLAGLVPSEICPILYGASLCALKKKDGGVRPIAVGSTIRRLVAKLGCTHIMPSLGPRLRPVQLGFGTRGGAEAAAHAAYRYVNHPHQDTKVLLKVDFLNAFNMVRRDRLLACVLKELPELYLFLRQCYQAPSHLSYGERIISSERGVQQGDPLGPALFCLIVQSVATRMKSEFNAWYLDDSSLGDGPNVVLNDLLHLQELSAEIGLELNPSKCELIIVQSGNSNEADIVSVFDSAAPGIKVISRSDYVLLGAPLSEEAISGCLSTKIEALKIMAGNLDQISAHHGFFLLKNSLAIPKLSYLLRSGPVWKDVNGLGCFDDTLRLALQEVTNTLMDEEPWLQSSLPVAKGGLGVRHASETALPAFLSSASSVAALVTVIIPTYISATEDTVFRDALAQWELKSEANVPPPDKRMFQRSWERPLFEKTIATLSARASNDRDKARLLSVSSKESGCWLNALPSPSLGTFLDDDSFRIAIGLRLGARICVPHTCVCGGHVDSYGTHGLSCKKSAGRFSRHAAVNDLLRRALVSAGVPSILEPPGLSRDDGKRPDGMSLVPWSGGKSLVWDFTCTDPLAPSYLASTSSAPLWAATQAEVRKNKKYEGLESRYLFKAVAIETLGSVGGEGLALLHSIGRRIREATGEPRSVEYLMQRVAIAVQRGNAASVLSTFPAGSSLEDVLYSLT